MAIYDVNGDEIIIVDDTLTQSGQAADAKKVGDELREIQDQISDGDERSY